MHRYSILLADDHPMILEGIQNLLERNPRYHIVDAVESGQEAIDKFLILKPDLLILDIGLPTMNGMEVSNIILSRDPHANILILSMHEDEDYIRRCLNIGVKGYVVKSEGGKELEAAVEAILNGQTCFSRKIQDVIFNTYSRSIGRSYNSPSNSLTPRELEIARLIVQGLTNQGIAARLSISSRTVETHRANLMKKTNSKNILELARKAQEFGILIFTSMVMHLLELALTFQEVLLIA